MTCLSCLRRAPRTPLIAYRWVDQPDIGVDAIDPPEHGGDRVRLFIVSVFVVGALVGAGVIVAWSIHTEIERVEAK